jgi:hypothetical protein
MYMSELVVPADQDHGPTRTELDTGWRLDPCDRVATACWLVRLLASSFNHHLLLVIVYSPLPPIAP